MSDKLCHHPPKPKKKEIGKEELLVFARILAGIQPSTLYGFILSFAPGILHATWFLNMHLTGEKRRRLQEDAVDAPLSLFTASLNACGVVLRCQQPDLFGAH